MLRRNKRDSQELTGYIQNNGKSTHKQSENIQSRLMDDSKDANDKIHDKDDTNNEKNDKKDDKKKEDEAWKKMSMQERRLNFTRLLKLSWQQKWLLIGGMVATGFSVV